MSGRGSGGAGVASIVVAFALVYVVWGSTYLAIAWAVETIPPFLMIGARCLLAGAVLYAWARRGGGPAPARHDWREAVITGTLLFVTGQAAVAWAETRIDSGPTALLVATEPLFIVLLGWWGVGWIRSGGPGPRPTGRSALALLAGFCGVAVMVTPAEGHHLDGLGVAAALLASLSWSVGVLRAERRPGLPSDLAAGMQLLAAGLVLIALSFLVGEPWALPAGGPSARSLLAFAYLVVFGSVVTYAAYLWLLDRVGPVRLSTHAYVNPVVAVALGAALGGEVVTRSILLATLLILGSVVVLVRRPPERSARRERSSPLEVAST